MPATGAISACREVNGLTDGCLSQEYLASHTVLGGDWLTLFREGQAGIFVDAGCVRRRGTITWRHCGNCETTTEGQAELCDSAAPALSWRKKKEATAGLMSLVIRFWDSSFLSLSLCQQSTAFLWSQVIGVVRYISSHPHQHHEGKERFSGQIGVGRCSTRQTWLVFA